MKKKKADGRGFSLNVSSLPSVKRGASCLARHGLGSPLHMGVLKEVAPARLQKRKEKHARPNVGGPAAGGFRWRTHAVLVQIVQSYEVVKPSVSIHLPRNTQRSPVSIWPEPELFWKSRSVPPKPWLRCSSETPPGLRWALF